MALIYYLPDEIEIEANEGETILLAALRAGIAHARLCGGNARCACCRVIIIEGLENCAPRNPQEQTIAELLKLEPQERLACQTVVTGKVKLRRMVTDIHKDVDLTDAVEKYILIFFADIRGFTLFAESLLPYDVIHVLNLYFQKAGEVIGRHGGVINNHMGDGFMALFEADDAAEGALQAIRAGLDLLDAVHKLEPYLEELYHKSFQIRIGLHFGQVVVGKLGSPGNKRITVIGDSVNFASRIEAANKRAGTQFLISEDAYALVEAQVRVGRRVCFPLPGKSGKYCLYEVPGLIDSNS